MRHRRRDSLGTELGINAFMAIGVVLFIALMWLLGKIMPIPNKDQQIPKP